MVSPESEAGERLKRTVHAASARAGIRSDLQLARDAKISYETLMSMYSGRTIPRTRTLQTIAAALGVRLDELSAAFDARPAEPDPLPLELHRLVDEIRHLILEIRRERRDTADTRAALLAAVAQGQGPARRDTRAAYGRDRPETKKTPR